MLIKIVGGDPDPFDGQGFDGHPFVGQGWPSKPQDFSPMIEGLANESLPRAKVFKDITLVI